MPRSKNPDNYPPHYARALSRAQGKPGGLLIQFPTRDQMERTRNNMYAYINALDKREEELNLTYDIRLAPGFRQVSLKKEGNNLRLLDKQFAPEVSAIEAALLEDGDDPIEVTDDARAQAAAAIAAHEAGEESPEPSPSNPGEIDFRSMFQTTKET